MIRNALSVRRVASIAALVLVAAAAAAVAQAAGGGSHTRARPQLVPAPAAMSAVPVAAPAIALTPAGQVVPVAPAVTIMPPTSALPGPTSALPAPPNGSSALCDPRRGNHSAPRTPPSDALKNAFGILRRERTDDDALPARALAALKAHGLEPGDPQSARLLRADGDARAWVVPVAHVGAAVPFACVRPAAKGTAREGLAVVSLGGAPAGGGGALRDLQRGLAPATLDPCAGTGRDMLGVSGIVPDGVEAVFVTAADGTSTRADVHDNAYSFVLPRPRRPEQRYLVWTGSDGAPRVQPLPVVLLGVRGGCAPDAVGARVTPSGAVCRILALGPNVLSTARPLRGARAARLRALARARARARVRGRRRPALPVPPPASALGSMCAPAAGALPVLPPGSGPLFVQPPATIPALPVPAVPPRPRPKHGP